MQDWDWELIFNILGLLLWLALVGGAGYVLLHFILKFW